MTELDLSTVRGGMRDGHTCLTAMFGGVAGGTGAGAVAEKIKQLRIPSDPVRAGRIGGLIAGALAVYFGTDACK